MLFASMMGSKLPCRMCMDARMLCSTRPAAHSKHSTTGRQQKACFVLGTSAAQSSAVQPQAGRVFEHAVREQTAAVALLSGTPPALCLKPRSTCQLCAPVVPRGISAARTSAPSCALMTLHSPLQNQSPSGICGKVKKPTQTTYQQPSKALPKVHGGNLTPHASVATGNAALEPRQPWLTSQSTPFNQPITAAPVPSPP